MNEEKKTFLCTIKSERYPPLFCLYVRVVEISKGRVLT